MILCLLADRRSPSSSDRRPSASAGEVGEHEEREQPPEDRDGDDQRADGSIAERQERHRRIDSIARTSRPMKYSVSGGEVERFGRFERGKTIGL